MNFVYMVLRTKCEYAKRLISFIYISLWLQVYLNCDILRVEI
jgi:hypothetical protein